MNKITRVSELITLNEVKTWQQGDIITITAGTGTGKSYFIKNRLYAKAKKEGKKILFLIHRTNCVNQFQEEIERDNKTDVITIRTYQHIESVYRKYGKYNFGNHDYIICDEFHYFLADAKFNKTTDISLDSILGQTNSTRIFMSATGNHMKRYINNYRNLETVDYELDINYDFIEELAFYYKDETLDYFIEESIKRDEKTIFFIQRAEVAYNLHKKYRKHTMFNCSEHNKKYYKHVNEDKVEDLLKNERFEDQCLITTTAMDAGVNIIDDKVKHIVVDVKDIGSLIQCIGRKRLKDKDDKIYLYVKNINNNQIGGMITQTQKKLEMAEYFKEHGIDKYVSKYEREIDKSYIIYDTVNEDGEAIKKCNDLMYFKNKLDITELEGMRNRDKGGYRKYMSELFGFTGDKRYNFIEEDFEKDGLTIYLNNVVNGMLYKSEQKELINKIGLKDARGRIQKGINQLNAYLTDNTLPYVVIKKVDKRRKLSDGTINKNRDKTYWQVVKTEIN